MADCIKMHMHQWKLREAANYIGMYVLPQNLVRAFREVIVFHLKNKVILLWYATVLEFFCKNYEK